MQYPVFIKYTCAVCAFADWSRDLEQRRCPRHGVMAIEPVGKRHGAGFMCCPLCHDHAVLPVAIEDANYACMQCHLTLGVPSTACSSKPKFVGPLSYADTWTRAAPVCHGPPSADLDFYTNLHDVCANHTAWSLDALLASGRPRARELGVHWLALSRQLALTQNLSRARHALTQQELDAAEKQVDAFMRRKMKTLVHCAWTVHVRSYRSLVAW